MAKKVINKIDFSKVAANVIKTPLETFVEDFYLPYAHYVIMNRALISDDGLKPVQRRILFAMHQLGLTDKKDYMKAAQIVGETMGKYHPHGDASIGDALSRMGQGFSMRVPLIDVQGSVGTFTGDDPAAPRYWEGRPTAAALELTKDLKEGAMKMGLNYDGKLPEPAMLPIKWPNGIINGSQGIAVGYSSNVIPHNPTEVMDAAIALVKNPDITIKQIMKILPGPDMATGGTLVAYDGVKEYFETGKGSFAIRGNYEILPGARGTHQIIFDEVPYQVSAEQIIQAIDRNKKSHGRLKEVSYVKDLSDMDNGFKLSIGIKAGANPNVVIKELFKRTPLEQTFSANMNVLKYGVPKVSNMKELLLSFVEFRAECIVNKINYKMIELDTRTQRLSAIVSVLVDIDKAINIIRKADDAASASLKLKKAFKLTDEQSEYILSMALRRLTKSDVISIKKEIAENNKELKYLNLLLKDEKEFNKYMITEMEDTKAIIGDARRTIISNKTEEDLKEEAKIARKEATADAKSTNCYITVFTNNTVTRTEKPYEQEGSPTAIIGHVRTKTLEDVLFITRKGEALKLQASYIPENMIIDLNLATGLVSDTVVGVGRAELDKMAFGTLIITSSGGVNIVNGGIPTSDRFTIVKLDEGETVLTAVALEAVDYRKKSLLMISSDGYVIHFPLNQIRTSNSGAGTILGMNIEKGFELAGASVIDTNIDNQIVSCTYKTIKVTNVSEVPGRNRHAKGVMLQRLAKEDIVLNAFASPRVVANKNDKSLRLPDETARALSGIKRVGTDITLGHHFLG